MKNNNRFTLMKIHALLAAFIFPAALMFLLTGALYTWGVKGGYDTTTHQLQLTQPIEAELAGLVALTKNELEKLGVEQPSGQAKIKKIGPSFKLEWVGSNVDVVLEPTLQPLVAQLQIKNTSLHRLFVQLHKAKGGVAFKVYAAVVAAALLLLLISGFIMAWQMPKLRKLTLVSTLLGIAVFYAMVVSS